MKKFPAADTKHPLITYVGISSYMVTWLRVFFVSFQFCLFNVQFQGLGTYVKWIMIGHSRSSIISAVFVLYVFQIGKYLQILRAH